MSCTYNTLITHFTLFKNYCTEWPLDPEVYNETLRYVHTHFSLPKHAKTGQAENQLSQLHNSLSNQYLITRLEIQHILFNKLIISILGVLWSKSWGVFWACGNTTFLRIQWAFRQQPFDFRGGAMDFFPRQTFFHLWRKTIYFFSCSGKQPLAKNNLFFFRVVENNFFLQIYD